MKKRQKNDVNETCPKSLANLFHYNNEITDYKIRNISSMKNSFMYDGDKLWNSISNEIRESQSLMSFQKKIAAHIF